MIKTHHNVDLLWGSGSLHPFRNLFKYEIRELARALKLPSSVHERNPFPGPGLYLRIIGTSVSKEKLNLYAKQIKTVSDILKNIILLNISQLIVALLGINSVGVKVSDERVYGFSLVVRAVQTAEFEDSKGYYFPEEVINEITNALTKHKNIVRVFLILHPNLRATTNLNNVIIICKEI